MTITMSYYYIMRIWLNNKYWGILFYKTGTDPRYYTNQWCNQAAWSGSNAVFNDKFPKLLND